MLPLLLLLLLLHSVLALCADKKLCLHLCIDLCTTTTTTVAVLAAATTPAKKNGRLKTENEVKESRSQIQSQQIRNNE